MNRRNLFRFAGLAAVAAIVPRAPAATIPIKSNPASYVVFIKEPDLNGTMRLSVRKTLYSRDLAIRYAMRGCWSRDAEVSVWGSFEEGCVLKMYRTEILTNGICPGLDSGDARRSAANAPISLATCGVSRIAELIGPR
jgi:hypothetical protein